MNELWNIEGIISGAHSLPGKIFSLAKDYSRKLNPETVKLFKRLPRSFCVG